MRAAQQTHLVMLLSHQLVCQWHIGAFLGYARGMPGLLQAFQPSFLELGWCGGVSRPLLKPFRPGFLGTGLLRVCLSPAAAIWLLRPSSSVAQLLWPCVTARFPPGAFGLVLD
jgi:hypothetical protein